MLVISDEGFRGKELMMKKDFEIMSVIHVLYSGNIFATSFMCVFELLFVINDAFENLSTLLDQYLLYTFYVNN